MGEWLSKPKDYGKRYWSQNSDRLCKLQRIRRAKNPEKTAKQINKYYIENRDRISRNAKIRSLKKRYGISEDQLKNLLAAVDNTCPVCRHKFDNKAHKACVDHCHNTGTIRGVLCIKCNFAEGALGTPEAVLRLYEYMKRNELFYQGVN